MAQNYKQKSSYHIRQNHKKEYFHRTHKSPIKILKTKRKVKKTKVRHSDHQNSKEILSLGQAVTTTQTNLLFTYLVVLSFHLELK